ncbi:HIT family protein [Georgenia yuyongxinii]
MSTVFSKIIAGEIPGRFVWADDRAVVFATIAPISDGHMLVVPREEVDQYTDAPDDLLAHLALLAKTVGRAQQAAFGSPRAAVLVAGFEVDHLHLHVLPAWDESSLRFDNARHDVPGDQLDAAAEKVRDALREAGHGANVPAER